MTTPSRCTRAPRPPDGFSEPPDPIYLDALADLFARHAATSAAVVVEPVVQGAGGMRMHNPAYVSALRQLANEHDVLLVCDEIATGFGRTGRMFATEWAGVAPDITCVGKALTGGMVSLAATVCTGRISDAIHEGPEPTLAHGPTFMANPLACAVACASIDVLLASDWEASVATIESTLSGALFDLASDAGVADVRTLGAIAVIETCDAVDVEAATLAAMANGVWIRPFGRLIYVMPPYCVTDDELASVTAAWRAAVAAG
jgi:adenosylmethionine-8-amino-7-oxononanoate aminotransferase